jgi:hypothetical protein
MSTESINPQAINQDVLSSIHASKDLYLDHLATANRNNAKDATLRAFQSEVAYTVQKAQIEGVQQALNAIAEFISISNQQLATSTAKMLLDAEMTANREMPTLSLPEIKPISLDKALESARNEVTDMKLIECDDNSEVGF